MNNYYYFLSSLNLLLLFIGVQFVTSFFLVGIEDSSLSSKVTIPYRLFVLILSLYLIFIKKQKTKISKLFVLWILFLSLFTLRICWDFYTNKVNYFDKNKVLSYIFLINFPIIYSLKSSIYYLDFDKVLKYIYLLSIFTVLFIIYTNPSVFSIMNIIDQRLGGSIAFSTITFGHFCCTICLLSVYNFIYRDKNSREYLISILVFIFCLFCLVKSGSRGPILSLILVCVFMFLINAKNFISLLRRVFYVCFLTFVLLYFFLQILKIISPYLEQRLRSSIENGDLGGREKYYQLAFDYISNNFLIGKQFMLKFGELDFDYTHNIFLDITIGIGLIGLLLFLYILIIVFKNINYIFKNEKSLVWLCLIFLQYFTFHFISGAFYMSPIFVGCLTILIFLNEKYFTGCKFISN